MKQQDISKLMSDTIKETFEEILGYEIDYCQTLKLVQASQTMSNLNKNISEFKYCEENNKKKVKTKKNKTLFKLKEKKIENKTQDKVE